MSGVWGWFGGQSAQKRKDTPKNAILGLRSQLEMLQKREKHLENQMAEQDAIARKNVSTNKNGRSRFASFANVGRRHRRYID
jgi:charged multivesicular body protein 4